MSKSAELKWLEKVFAAEVEARLPFQTKAAIMKRLEAAGLVERITVMVGNKFPARVEGWGLTHAGRLMYCISCAEPLPQHETGGK